MHVEETEQPMQSHSKEPAIRTEHEIESKAGVVYVIYVDERTNTCRGDCRREEARESFSGVRGGRRGAQLLALQRLWRRW